MVSNIGLYEYLVFCDQLNDDIEIILLDEDEECILKLEFEYRLLFV